MLKSINSSLEFAHVYEEGMGGTREKTVRDIKSYLFSDINTTNVIV